MPQMNTEIPMSKRFFPGLLPIVGDEKYKQVIARYQELYNKYELPKNPTLQWHLTEGILPGAALYQVLRESSESKESALASIDKTFEVLFADSVASMKKIGRLSFAYPLLRMVIKPMMRRYPAAGWKIEWLQNDREAVRFEMRSCFYFDSLTKYGAPELTASFCQVDDVIYGNMSPRIKWQRLQTIGRGQTYCDFCFSSVNKQKQEGNS
jgi:hypothetical protein